MNQDTANPREPRRLDLMLRRTLLGVGLIGSGMVVGSTATRPSTAWGEVRSSAPDQHYQSSSALTLPVLQDIAATLHQIDGRLMRLETIARQSGSKRADAPKP